MKIVYYSQEDPRWRHIPYSNHGDSEQTIGTSGCGPTSAAMAISSLIGCELLPTTAAAYAVANGYRTYDSGTSWSYFASIGKEYVVAVAQTGNFELVKNALSDGHLVVASMRRGHFTGAGHYILLVGIRDGWIEVYDPNMDNTKYGADGLVDQGIRNDGKVSAKESVFKAEANQYWIFNKEENGMTTSEKAAFELLEQTVKNQAAIMAGLTDGYDRLKDWINKVDERVAVIEAYRQMEKVPEWAKAAVSAAVEAELIDIPGGRSYDFYSLLTVFHRKGLF
ncbi:C39 family peptidase [Paenibacillus kobensis]|uniref:C39 family peptidase n=1 Tax=Paenibacillus kobensis TaxID=59841 RepID=UPI000FDC5775|nr:C39 family peptidase [Paenibacillus kobensis]